MGFAVVSCSSDDKDDDGGNNTEVVESLVGTWKCTFSTGYQLVTFKSNGKGTLLEVDEEDEEDGDFDLRLSGGDSADEE